MELEPLTRRVRAEFSEMPGLQLSPPQAMRLWGLEREVCEMVIEALVAAAFLRRTPSGTVLRTRQ